MDNAQRVIADDRLGDRQDLRGRRARRDRLRGQRVRLLGQGGAASTSPTSRVKSSQVLVKGKKLILRYRPLGLIGVIGPWNYPLTNSFGDCIPALMAGNSVILKPSEVTPLTSLLMAEGLRECGLPEDVLQIATGRGATGAALVEQVDMIMFTGSTRTGHEGRRSGRPAPDPGVAGARRQGPDDRALRRRPRARGELRHVLLDAERRPDVHLDRAGVRRGARVRRVRREGLREGARAARRRARDGSGSVEVGAITFPPQLDTIEDHVADAVAEGRARAHRRPRSCPGGGRFYEPTVLVDVDHTMKMHDRGDVRADAADHEGRRRRRGGAPGQRLALRPRLLGVHHATPTRGEAIARRLETGAANVNDAMINYTVLELPMGGAKASGLGSRHGAGGIRKYCSQQAIVVTPKLAMKKELLMYPYKARTSRLLAGLFKFLYGRGKRD